MSSFGTAYLDVAGDFTALEAQLRGMANGPIGKRMESLGKSLTKSLTLPLVGVGAVAAKMSMDFDRSMELIHTQAGASSKEVDKLKKSVLDLAKVEPQGPQALSEALFRLEGAGLRGQKAMKALKTSADLAAVGNANVEDTAKTLSQVWFTNIKGAEDFKKVAAEVNATVGAGDLRLPQLVDALGTGVLAAAKEAGLSLQDVNGAMAVFGDETNNVSGWAAQLATAFHFFTNPTEKAKGALLGLGLTGSTLAQDMHKPKGLITALADLKEHLDKLPGGEGGVQAEQALGDILPGGRGRVLLVLLNQLERYEQKMVQIKGTTDAFGKSVHETMEQPAVKLEVAWSKMRVALIELGAAITPVVLPALEKIAGYVSTIGEKFEGLSPSSKKLVVDIGLVVAALGPGLTIAGKLVGTFSTLTSVIKKAADAVGLLTTAEEAAAVVGAGPVVPRLSVKKRLASGLEDLVPVAGAEGVAATFVKRPILDIPAAPGVLEATPRGRIASSIAQSGEFAKAGAAGARSIAASLATKLGPAVAALGIGNIVSSVLSKDWRDAGFEAGGALAGGLAGFFLSGGNPLGAMLGVGIGSIGGELISQLFGDAPDKLGKIQEGLHADMKRLTQATTTQKEAFDGLANASTKVTSAQQRVHNADKTLKDAKQRLKGTEESMKGVRHLSIGQAEELARKENDVREAARGVAVAKRAEETVERLHGVRLKITKRELEGTVEAEKGVAERRAKQIGPLKHLLTYEENQGASRKRIIEIGKTLISDMEAQRTAQAKINEAEGQAAKEIGPKFADSLKHLKSAHRAMAEAVERGRDAFVKSHSILSSTDVLFGQKMPAAIGRTKGGYEQLRGVEGPFFSQTKKGLGQVGTAYGEMDKAGGEALGRLGTQTNSFLKAVHHGPLPFGLAPPSGKEPAKKARGGFIVPGRGDGDTFPAMIPPGSFVLNKKAAAAEGFQSGGHVPVMLEPGEPVFYPEAVHSIGLHNLEAANNRVRRFATGGHVTEPQIVGPDPLRQVGQGAIHEATGAVRKFIDSQRPKGLGSMSAKGSVADHPELQPGISAIVATILKRFPGLQITSTTGGGHAEHSLHYEGRAADLVASSGYMLRAAAWIKATLGAMLTEGIHNPNLSIKYGKEVPSSFWGSEVWAEHLNHIHVGKQLGGLVQALASGGVVGTAGEILLRNSLDADSAAGILGNAYGESGWVPSATDGAGNGGLWGFTAPPVSLGDLEAYASSQGKPWTDVETQTQFMLHHLDSGLKSKMNAASSTDETTSLFMHEWERPENYSSLGKRQEAAAKALKMIGGSSASDEHSFKEDVPAVYHGARTGSLKLGPMPKSLEGVNKELKKRREELPVYRHAAQKAQKDNKPAIEHAIRGNITDLESWVRQLDHERKKLRREKVQHKFTVRLNKRLAKLTGLEDVIAGRERDYNVANQYASQLVDLEPVQFELPASATDAQREASEKAYVSLFSEYVHTKESPAYADVLKKEAYWRNAILSAEHVAAGDWAAPGKLGGLEGNWEDQIITIGHELDSMKDFSDKVDERVADWQKNHGKNPFPDWLKAQVKKQHEDRAAVPTLKYKDREFRKVLGEGRGLFYPGGARITENPSAPLPGTGDFEASLEDVQGIQWPNFHELIGTLPDQRSAGAFGGAIWDTQTTIAELGLKVSQAANSVTPAGEPGKTEREELLETLLTQKNQRELLEGIEERVFAGMPKPGGLQLGGLAYGGKFHEGGVVPGPPTQEVMSLTRGGEAIFTEEQTDALGGMIRGSTGTSGPPVIEEMHVYPDGRVKMRFEGQEFETAVRKVTGRDERRGARGAGRGLAPPGVFGR